MNILELCLSPDFGGLEIHMRDLTNWLAQRNDCSVFIAVQNNSRIHNALASLNLPTFLFPRKCGKLPFVSARRLAKLIEQNDIDVVHVHWKYDLPLAALAKRFIGKPFKLIHTRQMNMPGKKFDPYHKFIYGSVDAFIAITKYLQRQAWENLPIPPGRIFQIYNGIEQPAQLPANTVAKLKQKFHIGSNFTVGLLGRISEYKGQHLLIEALEKLRSEGIKIHALIVGEPFEPGYAQKLERYVNERGLAQQIRFMAFYEKPIELISCLDALVLTTKKETFGLVLIEAMHAGVPVIGSEAGGVPEIIDHQRTGLLFKSWDADSLAEQVKKLFRDEQLRKKLAVAGREKAREMFDAETQYGKLLTLMKELTYP